MITLEQLQAGIVLPIDKPRQWTSFQAVNKVKAVVRNTYGLKKFKIGHAGTLDPLATGLLLICIGKATKEIPSLQDGDKVYTGTMVLGATTPCFDMEQAVDHFYPYRHITAELIDEVRQRFEGPIMQVPPMFSAVKIDGQRAYEYARRDDPTVTVQPKPVTIHSFAITAFRENEKIEFAPQPHTGLTASQAIRFAQAGENEELKDASANSQHSTLLPALQALSTTESKIIPAKNSQLYKNPQCIVPPHLPQADFRICCGKGTYIRSLARDFGTALGSGAFLASLRREQIGQYTVDQALALDQVETYFKSGKVEV